jgi:hypothetical protein
MISDPSSVGVQTPAGGASNSIGVSFYSLVFILFGFVVLLCHEIPTWFTGLYDLGLETPRVAELQYWVAECLTL